MQWENLTSLDFEKTVRDCHGVGIVPIGVLEAHASHLPLGTDMFTAHWTACRAAAEELAIVFPAYPYSINVETAHLPGSLIVQRETAFTLLENICDEMARHGLEKIILHTGHGGNRYFLPLFVQTLPEKNKPYTVYYADLPFFAEAKELLETEEFGHACEAETSMMLAIDENLVNMDQVPPKPFTSLERNKKLSEVGGYTQVDWYAMYPHMYVGDASQATPEKGKVLLDHTIRALVSLIQAVKSDQVTPGLVKEFNQRKENPYSPQFWTEP